MNICKRLCSRIKINESDDEDEQYYCPTDIQQNIMGLNFVQNVIQKLKINDTQINKFKDSQQQI